LEEWEYSHFSRLGVPRSIVSQKTVQHDNVSNILQCICADNYESWLAVDNVIAIIIRLIFWPTLQKETHASRNEIIEQK